MDGQVALVTGATGLLGNNLVRLLVREGFAVKALARSPEKARRQLAGVPVEVVVGDVTDVPGFAGTLRGVDVVFHTAAYFRDGYKGGSHWGALHRTNVLGTRALLEAAHAAGVRRFVHASSTAVLDGAPGAVLDETSLRAERDADDYFRSKIQSDREVLRFLDAHPEMFAALVLPGWMHGPGDAGPTSAGQLTLDFARGKLPGLVPGAFSVVDARDVAQAMLLAARKGRRGERYLAAGRSLTMAELARDLERVSGVPAPTRPVPFAALYALAGAGELWHRLTRRPLLISLATVRLMAREREKSHFDSSKAERELGVTFRPVEETLRDELAWYREHGFLPHPIPASHGQRMASSARSDEAPL